MHIPEYEILVNPPSSVWNFLMNQLADELQWNFCVNDYAAWKNGLDDFHLFVAFDHESKKAIGCITVGCDESSTSDNKLYYIATYYCAPAFRGNGIGSKLFNRVLEVIGDSNATLNAVPSMEPIYRMKHNFSLSYQHENLLTTISTSNIIVPSQPVSVVVQNVTGKNFDAVAAFDQHISSRDRSRYLKGWFDGDTFSTKVTIDENGDVLGYCCIRATILNTLDVAPLYAKNENVASALLSSALKSLGDLKCYSCLSFKFPSTNRSAKSLMQSFSSVPIASEPGVKTLFTKVAVPCQDDLVYSTLDCGHSSI